MKKSFFPFGLAITIGAAVLISFNTNFLKEKKVPSQPLSPSTSVDGAWELVWAKYNDTIASPHQFKMFNNGVFSLIATDASGKIDYAGYGKYELNGNSYKETFSYHNNPKYVGAMDWQTYEMKGDTLYTKGFNKVIVGGKEVTSDFPKIEEKRVRVK